MRYLCALLFGLATAAAGLNPESWQFWIVMITAAAWRISAEFGK